MHTGQGRIRKGTADVLLALAEHGPLAQKNLKFFRPNIRGKDTEGKVGGQDDIIQPIPFLYLLEKAKILLIFPLSGIKYRNNSLINLLRDKGIQESSRMRIEFDLSFGGIPDGGLPSVGLLRTEGAEDYLLFWYWFGHNR
jgi:hypothetical protein